MITVVRESMLSKKAHQMDLDITPEQYAAWVHGMSIQEAMPNLNADEREFIMTGITPEEWADTFGEEE